MLAGWWREPWRPQPPDHIRKKIFRPGWDGGTRWQGSQGCHCLCTSSGVPSGTLSIAYRGSGGSRPDYRPPPPAIIPSPSGTHEDPLCPPVPLQFLPKGSNCRVGVLSCMWDGSVHRSPPRNHLLLTTWHLTQDTQPSDTSGRPEAEGQRPRTIPSLGQRPR
jgi:hypothetical protein